MFPVPECWSVPTENIPKLGHGNYLSFVLLRAVRVINRHYDHLISYFVPIGGGEQEGRKEMVPRTDFNAEIAGSSISCKSCSFLRSSSRVTLSPFLSVFLFANSNNWMVGARRI